MHLQRSWTLVLLIAASYELSAGAPLTCDPVQLETCASTFTLDVSNASQSTNSTGTFASHICNVTYPTFQQCVAGCNYTTPNIWVSAVEFLCQRTETEQELGLECLATPGLTDAVVSCNSDIPHSTEDPCRLVTTYTQCVTAVTSQLCSLGGSVVVEQYMLRLLEPVIGHFNCLLPTPLPTPPGTPLPTPPGTPVSGPNQVCGTECLQYISHHSLTYNNALVRENFSIALLLDSCLDLSLYNQCMTKYPACDADNTLEHIILRNPIAFACGPGKQGIESNTACWDKPEVKQAWTWCTFGKVALDNNICTTTEGRMSCLNSEIQTMCPSAAALVNNLTVAMSSDFLRVLNCSITTPVPEVTDGTTSNPEPEPEVTDSPATPEPGPEVTGSPTSPVPEPEGTTPSTQSTTAPWTQCDLLTFNQCLSDLSLTFQLWMQSITSSSVLSNTIDVSALDTICRAYREEYKPCSEPAISGCSRDVTLVHETFTAALDYVCTVDRPTLDVLLPCLGEVTIVQGILQCNGVIPQASPSVCGLTMDYSNCVNGVVSGVCSDAARQALNEFLTQTLQPFNEYYGCQPLMTTKTPTTTTVSTTVSTTTTFSTTTFQIITDSFTSLPGMCTQDCRNKLTEVFSSTDINLLTYTQYCPLYADFKRCYDSKPASCKTPGPDDVINKIFNYTCGEGQEKIQRTAECWNKPEIREALIGCSGELYTGSTDRSCSLYTNYYSCLKTSMLDLCDQEAFEVLIEFVSAATQVERQRLGCPDPVITRPPMNIGCYDCHSGGTSWRNPHCTVEGDITEGIVAKTTCRDSCFAKTNRWNEGVVYRGCADSFLPMEYPRPLPRFGCRNITGETWCFCDGDACNNMSMSKYILP